MNPRPAKTKIERLTEWIGSVPSLVIHTAFFLACFVAGIAHAAPWDTILLVLTTIVSLEAIYLAIFIQMTVNRQAQELAEVSEDVDEIQEDIEEMSEDVEEIQKDVDEIQENVDEIQEDVEDISEDVEDLQEDVQEMSEDEAADDHREKQQAVTLETLGRDMQRILAEIDSLKWASSKKPASKPRKLAKPRKK